MTNKKFKVAAMSMALTACVAAQPLLANAADNVDTTPSTEPAPQQADTPETVSTSAENTTAEQEEIKNEESKNAVDVIGGSDVTVDYDHSKDTTTDGPDGSTTDSTGTVNRDVPKEPEPTEQVPAANEQQPAGNEQQPDADKNTEQGGTEGGQTDAGKGTEQGSSESGDETGKTEVPPSETEKKPIGNANKSETVKKDTDLVLGETTTKTETTTNPDGSTTTTTTTTTDATLETTTTGTGKADAKTEETTTEDVKKTLDDELDGGKLSWDTADGAQFGDYTVKHAEENKEDGSKTFTLTKEDKEDFGEMTGEDIAKLIEAGYTDNGDGTYTLTKEYTDSKGQKQTTTIKVDSSSAKKTTSTTLTITMQGEKHDNVGEDFGTKKDTDYTYPSITVPDNKGNDRTFNVKDILDKATDNKDGTFTYEDKENNLTYTIKKTETDTKLDGLSDTELRDLLNQNTTGNRYSVDKEGNLCYTTDSGEVCRVTDEQNTLLRSILSLEFTITDHHGKESDTKVDGSDKTPEEAKADAEKKAQEAALKEALAAAIEKETGNKFDPDKIDLSNATLNEDGKTGTFKWTDPVSKKEYIFNYTEKGTVSGKPETIKDPTTIDKDASSAEKNTETGAAEVTGSTVIWTDKNQTHTDDNVKNLFGEGYDFTKETEGKLTLKGSAEYDKDTGRLTKFVAEDGKTYTFEYTPGSAPAGLENIDNAKFTNVKWTVTKKESNTVTSPSEALHIDIERNFQKTENDGSFTFAETKENGKTYTGLKKVDGQDNVYRSEDGTVTITVTTSHLGDGDVRAALEAKGYTVISIDVKKGTASYKIGDVLYNVTYDTTIETITVTTKVVEKSNFTISTSNVDDKKARDELEAKIKALQDSLEEGEYVEVNGRHVDKHTDVEVVISYFKTAMNYKNMEDDDLIAMLKKQKEDADKAGKSYTGEGIGHNWWGNHYDTGKKPNYIGHLDLATDSDLLLEDGTTADAILLNTGDKKFKFEWNKSAEDLVNKDKKDTQAKFKDSISYDDGKQNGGDGSKGHYEYERGNGRTSWIDNDNDKYPHESAFYRLTGTIAYNSLENGKEYDSWEKANQALTNWRNENKTDADYKPNIVELKTTKTDRRGNEYTVTVYKAYTYESTLTAYGYMSKDSNTCVNSEYGKDDHGQTWWAGGYDLRISGLTQVTKTESSAHGKSYYDYFADIIKYKTKETTSDALTNRLLDVKPGTKTETIETIKTDTGTGLFGSYDQNHNDRHAYNNEFYRTADAEYTTYKTWEDTTTTWKDTLEKLTGAFKFGYTSTDEAKVTEATKETTVRTESSVEYSYSYVEREELDPITETKTVTTPGGGGDDGTVIDENGPDSPILPGNPELPPVQDARPDAPVLPSDPVLPPVQDARIDAAALPQTGVNWLTAIGLALSGMTLMATGAFATLTGKGKKEQQ